MENNIKNYKADKNSAAKAGDTSPMDLLKIPAYLKSIQSGRTGADRAQGLTPVVKTIMGMLPDFGLKDQTPIT